MPPITVTVPVYKVEPYLRRCVDSILNQIFTDFELILVDDGSPDGSGAICDEYMEKDKRVHVIHQPNGGLSAARNSGIDWAFACSDSEWLSFVDSDDWVHPQFLELLYRAVIESGAKVSVCGFVRVEEQKAAYPTVPFCSQIRAWDRFYIEKWGQGVVAWNKLYQIGLFADMRYPVGRIHEDEFLTYKILNRARELAIVDGDLYFYYQNPEGIIHQEFSLKKLDCILALTKQRQFARQEGNRDFYSECQRRLLLRCAEYRIGIQKADDLPCREREKVTRFLQREMRTILLGEGKTIAPMRKYKWYYEMAFPRLNRLYWTGVGISRKLKKMLKK